MHKSWITCLAVAVCYIGSATAGIDKWVSPEYKNIYGSPLPIPPVKTPLRSFTSSTGQVIDYFEVQIKSFTQQVYPGLKPARLVGYDGISPGPTFVFNKGRQAVVRFINVAADRANSVHLHGSASRAPFDGWAEDTTGVGQYKDYYYPNDQAARTLWYHDHAIDHTAENAYFGQAGFYLLHDNEELSVPGLPQGKYDIPLALTSKRYNSDGTLWSPEVNQETDSLWGDVIHVNGQPWPYLNVEPRSYRFRFLNTAVSRTFQLYFEDAAKAGTRLPFKVVASDAGLLTKPVQSSDLYMSMAERWEVVFDFSTLAGKNVTIRNSRDVGTDKDYVATDQVIQFRVGRTVSDTTNSGSLPATLRNVPFPPSKSTVDYHFKFEHSNSEWLINGVGWAAGPTARVLANVPRGKVEVWGLENSSGGWTHPIHVHLVDFQILKRAGGQRSTVLPYEAAALKDVVWLNKGETVTVIARYSPWDGLYMFHCHNLIHEDHEMMAAMNITALADLGYSEKTRFLDPMDPTYRAKSFTSSDLSTRSGPFSTQAIDQKLAFFASLEAYRSSEAEAALVQYWSTKVKRNVEEHLSTASVDIIATSAAAVTTFKTSVKA